MVGIYIIFGLIILIGIFLFSLTFIYPRVIYKADLKKAKEFEALLISVPKEIKPKEGETPKDFREVISVFEQLLANLYAIGPKQRISLEIIAKDNTIYFYIFCPKQLREMVEKQIHSFYPSAHIEEDLHFRFFKPSQGVIMAAYLKLVRKFIYPLKTYLKLESDPLNAVTNALSKLGENAQAVIQILIKPRPHFWQYECQKEAKKIQEGKTLQQTGFSNLLSDIGKAAKGETTKPYQDSYRPPVITPLDEAKVKAFHEKASKSGFDTQIKIITVAPSKEEAELYLGHILSSFSQFGSPEINVLKPKKLSNPSEAVKGFILKSFGVGPKIILNTEEIASLYHFPNRFIETPKIHWLLAKRMPPPSNLPKEGTLIGESVYRGEVYPVMIKEDDRRRHIYMVGKTGCGKTTIFKQMAESDIKAGKGVCYIDPHGDAIEDLLARIPKERAEDVIIFDPSDMERPCGLNLLEWKKEEDKDFLVAEWINIFYKLYDPTRIGIIGPQWEHWGRNAALTVMEQPGGGTLIEIPRLFTDKEFRDELVANVKNPMVLTFWKKQIAQTADFHKSEMLNYFVSKFGRFMTNTMMRNIIGQTKNSFDLRKIMDEGKILLVNLAKGKIGEMNSYLLGMILVSRLQMAAMSRADVPEEQRKDFYLYVDEFQNFTTESFISILSEARKYRLNLNVTNQYIAQLPEDIRNAVIGNAGTLISFRVGAHDAEFLVKEFEGLSELDLTNLDNYNAYIKLLIDGVASKPFSLRTIKPQVVEDRSWAESIKQLSRMKYGRDRREVEDEIYKRARLDLVSDLEGGSEASERRYGL